MVQKQPVLICILGFTTVFCVPKYIICLGEETTVTFAGSPGTYMTQFLLNKQEMLTWIYFMAMFKVWFILYKYTVIEYSPRERPVCLEK